MKKIYKDILETVGYDKETLLSYELIDDEDSNKINEWIDALGKDEEWAIRELASQLYQTSQIYNDFESWDLFKSLMNRLLKTVAKFNPTLSWSIQCHELNDNDKLLNK